MFAKCFKTRQIFGLSQGLVLVSKVSILGYILNLLDEKTVEHASLFLVHILIGFFFIFKADLRNFCKELNGLNSGTWRSDQVSEHLFNKVCLENISQGNPRKEGLQSLKALSNQGLLDSLWIVDGLSDHKLT